MEARREMVRTMIGTAVSILLCGAMLIDALSSHGPAQTLALVVTVLLALSCVGLRLRPVGVQVASRGIVLGHLMLAVVATVAFGRFAPARAAVFAFATLACARDPRLESEATRAAFSPVAYRRSFLAALVVQCAATFFVIVVAAVALLHPHGPVWSIGLGAAVLAALLAAATVAVVRMRAWGVFASALASAGLLLVGTLAPSPGHMGHVLCALAPWPLLVLAPVLHARFRRSVT